uniref:Palmitoyltransferase n=1 Tax=Ciona savignyi TaxID=51511 RepID=H2YXL5_CIOSA
MCGRNQITGTNKTDETPLVRKNGWNQPVNGLQVFSWILLVYFAVLFYAVEGIALTRFWWPVAFTIVSVCYVINVTFHVLATTINPADDNSLKWKKSSKPAAKFDRKKHRHVIENSYCHICEANVGDKSKHCSACNKCVSVFDHHCKWLNNCVGEKNYRYFVATIVSAILGSIAMVVISFYVFIKSIPYVSSNGASIIGTEYVWWRTSVAVAVVMLIFIALKIFFLVTAVILFVQLLLFHAMLNYRNITTYEYVMRNEKRKVEKKAKAKESDASSDDGAFCNEPIGIASETQRFQTRRRSLSTTLDSSMTNDMTSSTVRGFPTLSMTSATSFDSFF